MPENADVAVVVYGKGSRAREIEYPLDEVTHIQVCMAGAKLGNTHRQSPREIGRIFEAKEILPYLSRYTLKRRIEQGRLKPRTEEDFNNQTEYYEENGTWDFIHYRIPTLPSGMSVPIREKATVTVGDIPDSVKKMLNVNKDDEPSDDESESNESDGPNYRKMKKIQLQKLLNERNVDYEKKDNRDTLIQMLEENDEDGD